MNTAHFQVGMVAQALIRSDAGQHFAENCEGIHNGWALLQDKTTLPDNATCTDSRVAEMIRVLDNSIKCPENNIYLRITYVQLGRIMTRLKEKIRVGRRHGLIVSKRS